MKKIILTALIALSQASHAAGTDVIPTWSRIIPDYLNYKKVITDQNTLDLLKLHVDYRVYQAPDDSTNSSFRVNTDIIWAAPIIKGLMTFFTAKENSTKQTLVNAKDSFLKALLAIILLKSANDLHSVDCSDFSRKELAKTVAVAILRALASFSYICGQTDTGFGDVYRAIKKDGISSLFTNKTLSVETVLRQSANILLPLLYQSNIRNFAATTFDPQMAFKAEQHDHAGKILCDVQALLGVDTDTYICHGKAGLIASIDRLEEEVSAALAREYTSEGIDINSLFPTLKRLKATESVSVQELICLRDNLSSLANSPATYPSYQ
jgi:hypothetical protein